MMGEGGEVSPVEEGPPGLAINHGFWPPSPDGSLLTLNTATEDSLAAQDGRYLRPYNPSLTQFWQNSNLRHKSLSDDDITKAFLVLEANVPRVEFYGNKEVNRDSQGVSDRRAATVKPRERLSTSSVQPKGKGVNTFTNNTIASVSKIAKAERLKKHHVDKPEMLTKQEQLEKVYGQKYPLTRKPLYNSNPKVTSRKTSPNFPGFGRPSKSSNPNYKLANRDETNDVSEGWELLDQKGVIPGALLYPESTNAGEHFAYQKIPNALTDDSGSPFNDNRTVVKTDHKDSTDSEFELSTMPQPITRARFRDKSPNRQTIGNKVNNNASNLYQSNATNNSINSSNNVNNTARSRRDSGKRKNVDKPRSERTEERRVVEEDIVMASDHVAPYSESDSISNEEKLESYLKECLAECSRQRLRAIHMSMRRLGNVDSRISQKDLHQAFQENNVKLSNRVFHQINDTFVDHLGIDYERLHRSMVRAQLLTRRDSVEAMLGRSHTGKQAEMSRDKRDADFLRRLGEQLVLDQTFFDIDELKKFAAERDKNKSGKISKDALYRSCADAHIPLYGALLKNLVNYCDHDDPDSVSWLEFVSFLDRAQKSTIENHPEMAELPEKAKQKQMASPLDLMDPEKKSRIVRTLLKKASESRVNLAATTTGLSLSSEPDEQSRDEPKQDEVAVTNEKEVAIAVDIDQQASNERARKLFQKVRSSAGFLSSVRELLAGKKKSESELVTPIIEVEQPSEAMTEDSETPAGTDTGQLLTPAEDSFVTVRVKGRDVTLRKPAGYSLNTANDGLPTQQLQLDWVYGYRGNDCRSNLHVLATEEVAYFMSSIVILYSRETHSQRHYREHTAKIKSMAVHCDGMTVATGQVENKTESPTKAHVRVWRADSLETLHVLGVGQLERSVVCMAFTSIQGESKADHEEVKPSAVKNHLVAIDNNATKNVIVWDVETGIETAKTTIETEVICDVAFNPKYPDRFVTVGKEHVTWWRLDPEQGTLQQDQQPVYENHPKAKFVICLIHTKNGDLITGDSNGAIYVWVDGGNRITSAVKKAHDGPVFSLLLHNDFLLSGGRDSAIKCWLWGKNMSPLPGFEIPKSDSGVRTLQVLKGRLVIGTTTNSLLSGMIADQSESPLDGFQLDDIPITQGHYGDTRGLATITDVKHRSQFMTTALDGMICVFSAEKREPMWKLVLKGTTFNTVDCNPTGNLLVFGTKDGLVLILNVLEDHTFQEVFRHKITKDKVNCVKISPDTTSIAAGCGDKSILIYRKQTKEDGTPSWELHGKCKGHRGPVNAIDWSTEMNDDSFFLRSSSAVPEQFFWKVNTLEKVETVEDIQHICWASNLCTLDLSTIGVWSDGQSEEAEVQSVDVHPAKTLVARGDSHGYVSLFNYPSCRQGASSHSYKAHQSVHALRFVSDGKHLVTLGGADFSILQWKLV